MEIQFHDRILDSVETYFRLSPQLLALSLEMTGSAPSPRPVRISLAALREKLLDRDLPVEERDHVWSQLVRRAGQGREDWDVAAVWMMAPGLRRLCGRARRLGAAMDPAEIQAEAVAGFFAALRSADPSRPNLESWLWWSTYRHLQGTSSRHREEISTADIERAAGRTAGLTAVPSAPVRSRRSNRAIALAASEPIQPSSSMIEGERLGALAHRMGLDHVLAVEPAENSERAA